MEIRCTTCKAPIPVDDINIDTVLAKCRSCNSVFDFSGQVERTQTLSPAKLRRDRGEIAMPRGFKIDDKGPRLTITRRWGRGPGCFFLFFSLFWNAVTWTIGIAAFMGKTKAPAPTGLFLIPFVLIGAATFYAAIALLSNRTEIRMDGRRLTVVTKPIPWPGSRNLDAAAIDQLFCVDYVAYSQNDVPQHRFAVEALMKDGRKLRLIRGMEEPDQALYLEGLLEKRLGIQDRPMPGEISGA